jgi:hypothetical protein
MACMSTFPDSRLCKTFETLQQYISELWTSLDAQSMCARSDFLSFISSVYLRSFHSRPVFLSNRRKISLKVWAIFASNDLEDTANRYQIPDKRNTAMQKKLNCSKCIWWGQETSAEKDCMDFTGEQQRQELKHFDSFNFHRRRVN